MKYSNWQAETGTRRVVPVRIYFGHNEWHTKPQWLMEAWDLDRQALRHFALQDISEWHKIGHMAPKEQSTQDQS